MSAKSKLLILGLFVLCFIAACAASGCSSYRSSFNGRDTWGIGLFQMREGRGDTVVAVGTPAEAEAERPHAMASESDGTPEGTSSAIRAMYAQKGGR